MLKSLRMLWLRIFKNDVYEMFQESKRCEQEFALQVIRDSLDAHRFDKYPCKLSKFTFISMPFIYNTGSNETAIKAIKKELPKKYQRTLITCYEWCENSWLCICRN